jgi:D-alanyl-D-alanine dipeptidase
MKVLNLLCSILVILMLISSCKAPISYSNSLISQSALDSLKTKTTRMKINPILKIPADTTFVNLKTFSADFYYDMKYATENNFLNAKVYNCDECYLRYSTVKYLIEANSKFMRKGFKIKLFDCYRPLTVQKKMWQILPNPKYVANPAKGSIHNRGGAVDITLVDEQGNEVDMGTAFDYFGNESSHLYENLSDEVIKNRKFLKKIMLKSNFKSFDSEWWHYNLKGANDNKVSDFKWLCD